MRYLGTNLEFATHAELERTFEGTDMDIEDLGALDGRVAESIERYHLNFVPAEMQERCRLCNTNTACCESSCERFERAGRAYEVADREVDLCRYCVDLGVRCAGYEHMTEKLNREAKKVRIKDVAADREELKRVGILTDEEAVRLKDAGIDAVGDSTLTALRAVPGIDDRLQDRIVDYLFGKVNALLAEEGADHVAEAQPRAYGESRETKAPPAPSPHSSENETAAVQPIRVKGQVQGCHIRDFEMPVGTTVYTNVRVLYSKEGYDNPYYGFFYGDAEDGSKHVVRFKVYDAERVELSYDFGAKCLRNLMYLAVSRAVRRLDPDFVLDVESLLTS